MDVSLFDFHLPEERIALRPAVPRDSARMLVVHSNGFLEHRTIGNLPEYMQGGDALVVNDSRVIAARLHGVRLRATGPAKVEILLHRRLSTDRYSILARPARKLMPGDALVFGRMQARVVARGEHGEAEIAFDLSGAALDAAIAQAGEMPLPPYIAAKREADARDASDYQTVFADQEGSVAAPTAGLHFTSQLLSALAAKGVVLETLTLHVGLGTFLPVTAEDTGAHRMHA
jgi:S-adenosylmethionine:tRNA ribosyltransferase-isomerase